MKPQDILIERFRGSEWAYWYGIAEFQLGSDAPETHVALRAAALKRTYEMGE